MLFRIYVYPCGCSVGRDEDEPDVVTSVGLCGAHRSEVRVELGYLARIVSVMGRESGEPSQLDSMKIAGTLEKVIELERAEEGETDGSA